MTCAASVTIDRSELSLSDLVMTSTPGDPGLGISRLQVPGYVSRVTYMPDSADVNGSEAIARSWQQGLLSFSVITDNAADESAAQVAVAALVAAVGQFSYTVTTVLAGAPAQVWLADSGAVTPVADRSLSDLESSITEWSVTIPVYPIPSTS